MQTNETVEATKDCAQPGVLHRLRNFFETHPGMYLLGGILSVFATVITIATLYQIMSDLRDRREERAQRAWEHLLTKNGGVTGKGYALRVLVALGQDVEGINLSCENVGEWKDDECRMAPTFSNFRLPGFIEVVNSRKRFDIPQSQAIFEGQLHVDPTNFSGSIIREAQLSGFLFLPKSYDGTLIVRSNLSGSQMDELMGDGFDVFTSDLSDSIVNAANLRAFTNSNLSGVKFLRFYPREGRKDSPGVSEHIRLGKKRFGLRNWFWADRPPQYYDGYAEGWAEGREIAWSLIFSRHLTVCDPRFRGPKYKGHWEAWIRYFFPAEIDVGETEPYYPRDMTVEGSDYYVSQSQLYFMGKRISVCPRLSISQASALFPEVYRATKHSPTP